jgi:hypothetical protein
MKKPAGILLPFLVLVFVVMGCTEEVRQKHRENSQREKINAEREKEFSAEVAAREKFANKLSDKFELPGSRRCVADFFAEGSGGRILRVEPCSVLTERGEKIDLHKLFEPETMQELKRLGFSSIETKRDGKAVYRLVE